LTEALIRKLETRYGGSVPFSRAATLLGVSERVLMQRMVAGEFLAVDHDNQFHFPMFQFTGRGMIRGLSQILKSAKAPTEEVLYLLLEEFMDGHNPIDLLKEGITEVELNEVTETLEAYFNGDLAP
jgi:hypothetical protein